MNHVRVRGKTEIKALTDQVFATMQHAELIDELRVLHQCVFSLDAEVLFDTTLNGNESVWTLKPMVELLLLQVRDIAMSPKSPQDKRDEIFWAIGAAGF